MFFAFAVPHNTQVNMSNIYERRKQRLRAILRDDCEGKQAILCERLGKSQSTVSRFFSDSSHRKNIGEELAREIEDSMGKPPYWLDGVEERWWPFKNIPLDTISKLPPEKRDQLEQSILSILSLIS